MKNTFVNKVLHFKQSFFFFQHMYVYVYTRKNMQNECVCVETLWKKLLRNSFVARMKNYALFISYCSSASSSLSVFPYKTAFICWDLSLINDEK